MEGGCIRMGGGVDRCAKNAVRRRKGGGGYVARIMARLRMRGSEGGRKEGGGEATEA